MNSLPLDMVKILANLLFETPRGLYDVIAESNDDKEHVGVMIVKYDDLNEGSMLLVLTPSQLKELHDMLGGVLYRMEILNPSPRG